MTNWLCTHSRVMLVFMSLVAVQLGKSTPNLPYHDRINSSPIEYILYSLFICWQPMAWLMYVSSHRDPLCRMQFSVRHRGLFPMVLNLYFRIDWNWIWSRLRCNWVYYQSLHSYSSCGILGKIIISLIAIQKLNLCKMPYFVHLNLIIS